jgi:hypothetical protein
VRGGPIHSASYRWPAFPASDPVSPEDGGATILHALVFDPARIMDDALDRHLGINDSSLP